MPGEAGEDAPAPQAQPRGCSATAEGAAGAGAARDLFPGAGGLDHLVPRLPEYGLLERCRTEQEIFGFMVTRHPLELLPEHPAATDPGKSVAGGGVTRSSERAPTGIRSACPPREGLSSRKGSRPLQPARASTESQRTDPPLITSADLPRYVGRRVRLRGLAISSKRLPTKAGAWMKFLSLEDLVGTFEAVLFPAAYARFAEATLGAGPFLVEGRVDVDHGVPSLAVTRIAPLGPDP